MPGNSVIEALQPSKMAFIERFGQFVTELGLPPSMARVFGLLLISEPRYQSAEMIQTNLRLSVGSVSSALLFLQRLGLINRVTFPQDRRFYYEVDDKCWQNLVQTRQRQMERGIALADEGLKLSPGNHRLKVMRDFYEAFKGFLSDIKI